MRVNNYRLGVMMPGILLSFVPAIAGIISGISSIFIFGLLFILVAGGDILILWLLRNVKPKFLAKDQPTRVGCFITNPKESNL